MIHVNKDYKDIPYSLKEAKYNKNIGKIQDVHIKLNEIYNGKCAYCESHTLIYLRSFDKYRPKSYTWLSREWSNLLFCCRSCSSKKSYKFPLRKEENRKTESTNDKNDLLANSKYLLSEEPLILNPEIDFPEEHFYFTKDGIIKSNTERGQVTIDIIGLNRMELCKQRFSVIDYYTTKIKLQSNLSLELKNSINFEELFILLLKDIFNSLKYNNIVKKEFTLLLFYLTYDYEEFFEIDKFNSKIKDIIVNLFEEVKKENLKYLKNRKLKNTEIRKKKFDKIKINNIAINNVRCFNKFEINFDKKNTVILGNNAAGKSTILQLIAFALNGTENPPNEWNEVITKGEDHASFKIDLEINNEPKILTFKISDNDKIIITDKNKKLIENILIFAYGSGRSSKRHDIDIDIIKQTANVSTLIGINQFEPFYKYKFLEQKKNFNAIKTIIDYIFNGNSETNNIEIESYEYDTINEKYNFFFSASNNDNLLPLEALSDGFRTSFLWIIDFLYRLHKKKIDITEKYSKPFDIFAIVLLDEIDLHLHPKWQQEIMPRLTTVFPNIQFIVTTHSPFIVQSIESKVVLLEQNNVNIEENDVSKWRIDQILSSNLFNITSLRSKKVEAQIERQQELLEKDTLSEVELAEFEELDNEIDQLPTADNKADIEAMKIINDFAKKIKSKK